MATRLEVQIEALQMQIWEELGADPADLYERYDWRCQLAWALLRGDMAAQARFERLVSNLRRDAEWTAAHWGPAGWARGTPLEIQESQGHR